VTADGSLKREDIAPVDKTAGAANYGRPALLPSGKGALVSVGYNTGTDKRHIGVVSIPGGKLTIIPEEGAINPRYSESGHILYTVDNVLRAIPFDLDRLAVTGPSATIVEGVHVLSNSASQFDISKNGVLVYIPGPCEVGRASPKLLVWVDRTGREQVFHTAEKDFGVVRFAPNRRYVAAENGTSLYIYEALSGTWRRLGEATDSNGAPVWAADSSALFYTRGRSFGRQAVDANGVWGEWKELFPNVSPQGFWGSFVSRDGAQMLGTSVAPEPEVWRLGRVPVGGATAAESLLGASTRPRRNPVLSQDGKWLAYVEKDKGSLDHVYVEPFPSGGTRLLVSQGDAAEPVWGLGLELFYRDATHMVSVRLETTPALRVVDTTRLFSSRSHASMLNKFEATYDYDAATDRFLLPKWSIPELPGTDIQVIKNGFEVLRSLAPARK
jgi:hypothetical protein